MMITRDVANTEVYDMVTVGVKRIRSTCKDGHFEEEGLEYKLLRMT
jgi:hypothetical protein